MKGGHSVLARQRVVDGVAVHVPFAGETLALAARMDRRVLVVCVDSAAIGHGIDFWTLVLVRIDVEDRRLLWWLRKAWGWWWWCIEEGLGSVLSTSLAVNEYLTGRRCGWVGRDELL